MSTRNVYLISVPAKDARPHWTIWIPQDSDNPLSVGKRIEAIGAPQFGFKIEVEHAFDWRKVPSSNKIGLFLLGTTDASHIIEVAEPTKTTDMNKNDKFEEVASKLKAPRAASRDVMPIGTVSQVTAALQHDIPGMRRCQEWTMGYIDALIKADLLPNEATTAVAEARQLNPFPPTD
ncbi:hypothetical protein D9619_013027 [Psilocybe cf. subviscida]|uniref:Uncharacterized protein n=1 Tax=Psilocybe cf. subviscida TaxID=2480587 RepID=A0A8H5B0Q9_9AGAR|nr:hypothetical protein D9619_013027 [Psilocybe cf. subviscida]